MSSPTANKAAWLPGLNKSLEVGDAPARKAEPGKVVIRVQYVGINPVDWKQQLYPIFISKYPTIIGSDIAGEVVEVGEGVKHVKAGDRVLAYGADSVSDNNDSAAFQLYSLVEAPYVVRLPDSLSLAEASVLPLALATAAHGLFSGLGLPLPLASKAEKNRTLLVWGGASSVGLTTIQLAKTLGLRVITTASPQNHALLKDLGAAALFDYKDPEVADKLINAVKGSELVGAFDAISEHGSVEITAKVVSAKGGGTIALVLPPPEGLPSNVKTFGVFAGELARNERSLGDAIFQKFLGPALIDGKLKAKPDPLVVEGGLEKFQEALDLQKKGVSAKKVVLHVQ